MANAANCLQPTRFGGMGGGVAAEIFSDLQKPTTFGGGGVVADIVRDLQEVVAEFCSVNCNNRP